MLSSFSIVPSSKTYTVLEHESFLVQTKSEADYRFFVSSEFDAIDERMEFLTRKNTSQIRIYDQYGSQEFLLPVNADKVILNKSIFKTGKYTLVFDVEEDRSLHRSFIEIY